MRDRTENLIPRNRTDRPGRTSHTTNTDEGRENTSIPHVQPRASSRINDNYCVTELRARLLVGSTPRETLTVQSLETHVNLNVVNHVRSATGHPQRKGISPGLSFVKSKDCTLKHVKGASSVIQLPCVQPVTNVPLVVKDLPVGARLQNFWQTWLERGAGPKIVQVLREGYTLPIRIRPNLTRSPTVISRYANLHRNSYLLEALHQLIDKNAIELVHNQTSLGFFNRLFLVPKPNNKWRPILDLSKLNLFLKVEKFKMETPETIRTSLQRGEWVTSVDFKDAYFHIPIQEQSRKCLRFHVQGRTYKFRALPFGLSTAPMEFTVLAKEVKLMAIYKGVRIHQYLDDWLVRARSHQACLHHTQILVKMCQDLGWLVNLEKSELEPKQVFNFVGYQFDLRSGQARPTPDRWQSLQGKIQTLLLLPACPVRQFMSLIGLLTATEKQVHLGRLHMRPIQWHLKNNWRVPESLEKVIPLPRSLHPHLQWWLNESNVLQGQPLHPIKHALQMFTDASKEGWGTHLNELTARGSWSVPESKLHINYLELKADLLALKEFQDLCTDKIVLVATDNTTVVAYINKEGGMKSGPLCALLWRILTWCSQRQVTLKARHIPGRLNVIADKLSRLNQTIQTEWSLLPDVFQRLCSKWHRPQIDLFATRFSHKLPLFVSSTGHPGCSSGCTHSAMGGSGRIRLPTDRHIGESGGEATGLPVQETHSDCPGVAQHALVLGLGDHVKSGPSQPAQPAQSADTALQSDPSQKSDKSKSPCLAPRATKIKEQGFSETVAARIEAPQRRSTRSVYEAKWAIFTKWCVTNQVDFRSPPVKSVADFLMYLFEDKKLQPSTIDGYRSAIADKLGNTTVNISKDDNLTRLLESFHRDRPKGRRGIPSWNLSLVLHQLTKAPFEPLREASLKHLTFKTVFLLTLGSGKRRSEIHAWQHKNIRHQSDWSKVSLFPSPSFLSKNQLAKEGPESVAPVVIPDLAPTLDKSLKSDRSLCPVRALRYYLDRTSDLRQHKELVFVSFKKGFDKDISPATISSWIKQTVILCYELADHQAHTLHQVKAHDVRAFAASKAFQSGVSLEQILSACHWKSHNTFTQFYLKDVAWADSELFHLGPVVAAQQIHQTTRT